MNWTNTALLATLLGSAVSIIDSHLLSRRMPSIRAFLLPMSIIMFISGLIVAGVQPWPESVPIRAILAITGSTIFSISATLITFFNLRREEVSRVVPILSISPVFTTIIATLFLNERPGYLQWLAIVIIAAGAAIITMERSPYGSTGSWKKPFMLLFAASLLIAVSSNLTKYALGYVSFWNMYSVTIIITSIVYMVISVRPATIKQLKEMRKRNSTLALYMLNEAIALTSAVLHIRAISLGPISLVATIMGTRPVLTAIYSMILGIVMPGFLMRYTSNRVMVYRFIAIFMIVSGVSIIYLT